MQPTALKSLDDADYQKLVNPFGETREIFTYYAEDPGPRGFMVRMAPNNTVVAHFHRVKQFQLFLGAPGAQYLRSPIDSLLVHYADPFVTYGPFGTGDVGMDFFTLRADADNFTGFMPQDREMIERRGRRNLHAPVPLPPDLAALESALITPVLEAQPDGLSADLITLGSHQSFEDAPSTTGGGRYYVVVDGAATVDGQAYELRSLVWRGPDAGATTLQAGAGGVAVLRLQFPGSDELMYAAN